jgi:hypothetical protein
MPVGSSAESSRALCGFFFWRMRVYYPAKLRPLSSSRRVVQSVTDIAIKWNTKSGVTGVEPPVVYYYAQIFCCHLSSTRLCLSISLPMPTDLPGKPRPRLIHLACRLLIQVFWFSKQCVFGLWPPGS